jgi:GT2 family glycosyltransferase
MQFIVPPIGEVCDVIILTNTVDKDVFDMTENAIQSLRHSESQNKFRVILVESNQDNSFSYTADIIVKYTGEFSYNKALNMAFENLQSDWVYVSNNDVIFQQNWYSTLRYYMDIFDLDSASPRCPTPQQGTTQMAQQMILGYPECSVILGFQPIIHFCGWGWLMKRSVLELIRPFPEDLKFWFQDNHMALLLQSMGKKHGCVTSSHVIHFGQRSYRIIKPEELHNMTHGLLDAFKEKWESQ